MCDRKDGAIEQYHEARDIVDKEYNDGRISYQLYNNIKTKLVLLREHMDDSDHRTFTKEIYDALNMQEVCDKCCLPPTDDCSICNGTQVNGLDVSFTSLDNPND